MEIKLILWTLYEVKSSATSLTKVKFRGTLRKFAIEKEINLLVENATDKENTVRFALINDGNDLDINLITKFLNEKYSHQITIDKIPEHESVFNPVLSKIDVNNIQRY